MKPQAVSNQFQRLQDKGIVAGRRDGNNVYYRIVDNCVIVLLERGLCLMEESAKRADVFDRLSQSADDNGVEVLQTFHLSAVAAQESTGQV